MERRRKVYTTDDKMEGVIAIINIAKLTIKKIEYTTFLTDSDDAVYAITIIATAEQFMELQTAISYHNGL